MVPQTDGIISHRQDTAFSPDILLSIRERLQQKKDLVLPLAETLQLSESLSQFSLGQYLLTHGGLNGFWTQYIILAYKNNPLLHPLERWILEEAPVFGATQERFAIFRQYLQKNLKPNMSLASVPCGLMDDLLGLDYQTAPECQLYGIDLDDASLEQVKQNAKQHNITSCHFLKRDAWHMNLPNAFDIITSNGLNIYEPDENRVIALYKEFYNSLRTGGLLITSFLTPPDRSRNSDAFIKQRAIFSDILGVNWQCFRTKEETRNHMQKAGLVVNDVIYDSNRLFPTIIASRP